MFYLFYSCSVPLYAKLVLRYTWTSRWDCWKFRFCLFFLGGFGICLGFSAPKHYKKWEFDRPTHGIFFLLSNTGQLEPCFVFFPLKSCSFRTKLRTPFHWRNLPKHISTLHGGARFQNPHKKSQFFYQPNFCFKSILFRKCYLICFEDALG